jgi:hypothetical protein
MGHEATGAEWFRMIVTCPDPAGRIVRLEDKALAAAMDEIAKVPAPNHFQVEVYARCAHEALRRWRMSHESRVTGEEPGKPKGVFTQP